MKVWIVRRGPRVVWILIGFLTLLFTGAAQAEQVVWREGKQIYVALNIEQERKIHFPEPVKFAYKAAYSAWFDNSLINTVFFIKPRQAFKTRALFRGLNTEQFYMLELSASEHTTHDNPDSGRMIPVSDDLVIVSAETSEYQKPSINPTNSGPTSYRLAAGTEQPSPIDLVQYAAQALYAPDDVYIEATPGIQRIPVRQPLQPHIYRGGKLTGEVVASWQGGGLFVTAMKLSNVSQQEVTIQPCFIRGDFHSVTPQFKHIYPASSNKNYTLVYLLSRLPFDKAVTEKGSACE